MTATWPDVRLTPGPFEGCEIDGTSDSASDPAEGPRIPLGSAAGGEAPTPGGFLGSINQFMTAPLDGSQDGSQGVTVRRRRGLDYRESHFRFWQCDVGYSTFGWKCVVGWPAVGRG
uniref:Uncharacterized protein n=1 Tax=Sphaerodactylus townsendi TaxID=933632 RepID=A0ACB8EC45_9SAUR